jgi:hypoxanthine-guanine phosphoribosyltransferase
MADLLRKVDPAMEAEMDFIKLSSYDGNIRNEIYF